MKIDGWRERLRESVEASGRSMRDISLDAKLSPGYLHSVLSEGKEPSIGKLAQLTDAIGASLIHILYAVEMSGDAEELLRHYASLPDGQKEAFLNLLKKSAPRKDPSAS